MAGAGQESCLPGKAVQGQQQAREQLGTRPRVSVLPTDRQRHITREATEDLKLTPLDSGVSIGVWFLSAV